MTCLRKEFTEIDGGGIPYKKGIPIIQANNISYTVNNNGVKKLLLRDIGTEKLSFRIFDIVRIDKKCQGQTIAVLGRSGAGKSTFFKILSGLNKPTTGEVLINKSSLIKVNEGDVGLVQQNYPLSRNQTILSMLQDASKISKIPKHDRNDIIEKYLKDWDLFDQRYQSSNQLSGGQRQRVAIIEQLMCSHNFIILDEPFSGLDVKNVDDLKDSFNKITSTNSINTIIFSTHIIEMAVEMADQIYVMGHEKNIEGGTIITQYDLKQMGLSWKPYGIRHQKLKEEIEKIIRMN